MKDEKDNTTHTNRELLGKGVQKIAIAFILMFLGPVLIHNAFQNKEHFLYYPVLSVGLLVAGFAIFMGFQGIKTMMDAFFGKR